MYTAILVSVILIVTIPDLVRLFRFGNAAGLGAVISRPLWGLVTTTMFWGLIIWIAEIFSLCRALLAVWQWIF